MAGFPRLTLMDRILLSFAVKGCSAEGTVNRLRLIENRLKSNKFFHTTYRWFLVNNVKYVHALFRCTFKHTWNLFQSGISTRFH